MGPTGSREMVRCRVLLFLLLRKTPLSRLNSLVRMEWLLMMYTKGFTMLFRFRRMCSANSLITFRWMKMTAGMVMFWMRRKRHVMNTL